MELHKLRNRVEQIWAGIYIPAHDIKHTLRCRSPWPVISRSTRAATPTKRKLPAYSMTWAGLRKKKRKGTHKPAWRGRIPYLRKLLSSRKMPEREFSPPSGNIASYVAMVDLQTSFRMRTNSKVLARWVSCAPMSPRAILSTIRKG